MRVLVATGHGGPEVLELRDDHPEPSPGPNDLLVRVRAAALNPVDTKIRAGYLGERPAPYVLGFDVSGVVARAGSDVSGFAAGDEVIASPSLFRDGSNAELVLVDHRRAALKPPSLDHEHAAALPLVAITAWEALYDRAEVGTGEWVLVHAGAGGVGHIGIQLARLRYANVIATASREESKKLCKDLGAEHVIDHRAEDVTARVLELTGGAGCPLVFDTVGGAVFESSLDCVAVNGRVVTIVANESPNVSAKLFVKNATLIHEFMGAPSMHGQRMEAQGDLLGRVGELVEAGSIRPVVSRTFPLAEVPEAHRALEAGHTTGKIAIRVSS